MSNSNFSSHGVQSHHATPRNLGIQSGKLSQEQNSLLRQQNTKLDTIVTNTASVNVNTDTLEALTTSGNNILTSIDNKIILPSVLNSDQLKVNDSAVVGSLAQINNNVDGLETAISDTNSKIDAMRGSNSITDLATKLNAGLPSALSSDQLKVTDGDVASKIDAMRASDTLTSLKGALALNSTLNDTNSKIDAMRGSNSITDLATKLNAGLPSALDSDQLKVKDGDLASKVDAMRASDTLTTVKGAIDIVEVTLTAIETDQAALEVLHTATNSKLDTIDGVLDNAEAHLGNIETSVQLIDDVVKTEDTAHSSGDKGVMILGVRQSSQADFGADGDYVPISVNDDGEIRVTSSGGSGGATEAKQDVIETTLTAIETDAAAIEVLLTGIDADTDAIKTSVAAIDNAVDGNYLNVNLNLAGTDVDGNSGNKSAATPRVVVATDDINMSAIKTATEASATDLAALEVLQTSTNSKLDHLSGNLDTLETTLTAIETDQAAIEVLLTGIDADTDACKTSLAAIDNAVDGNYLNVNLNLAGSDVDANSGNKSAATPRVVVATDDVNMSAIKTATEASATDLAALEVLQTSTNSKLDHLSDNLDTLETTLTAIETDQAALEVLHTATNSKIDTLDSVLDTIKVDTEAIETAVEAIQALDQLTTTLIIDGQTVASGGGTHTSGSFEITKKPKGDGKLNFLIRISGVSAGDIAVGILVSADDTNFFGMDLGFTQNGTATTGVGKFVTCSYVGKHIKIILTNTSFSSNATCTVHMFS